MSVYRSTAHQRLQHSLPTPARPSAHASHNTPHPPPTTPPPCPSQALIDSCSGEGALANEPAVRAVALFDHEEVGSDSAQGAGSPVMRDTIKRVSRVLAAGKEGAIERAMRNSFLVSADMAHALHPNYTDKHDPEHQPMFHKVRGLVWRARVVPCLAADAVTSTGTQHAAAA